ncbi:tyrosine transporter [Vibrio sp. OCN044]|uniref:Tyrosine transporter n=1 Tax=Vibrio tetraodonis subsp. pristinus TaxID=2695891 RepID=A0A6L8M0B1_9VIBR|nr:aromatic amino acid transport family protein [Vibrio tetraodonis]MYM60450.1 tyrosine transporter [Vibrio tetraodonis subsp. pristinus]
MNTKLLGSSLIISGTALGAGMLAIPMVLAQFGLWYGTLLMIFICFGTTYAALLLLEATLKTGSGLGLNSIARQTLGKPGQLVTNLLLYALLICLLMAYILGAADLLGQFTSFIGLDVSLQHSQIAFTLVSGIIIACGTGAVDKLNRLLFFVMIISLGLSLLILLPDFKVANIAHIVNSDKVDLIKTSAVLFTSFGFMVVIPSLVAYNHEADDKQLRNMIIIGSMIPLICYLCWLFAVVGNLRPDQLGEFSNVSELILAFGDSSQWIGTILSIFTGLALLTSFFGVAMSLYNQNRDTFGQNRVVTYVLTFILPLAGALLAADKFLAVLSYAGIILVFLAVFVPLAMVYVVRSQNMESKRYKAEGGNIMLLFSLGFGVFLIASQLI